MTVRTGMARFPVTDYKTSRYCIAYLDVLGGANKICYDKDNSLLNYLNMIMKDGISEANNYKIYTKIFSDNILFATKITDNDPDKEKKIAKIFNLSANFSNEMFRYGNLVRGAIVIGDFFYNENIVYGEALVRAVKIEETEAIYPRIIIQNEIADLLPQYCLQDLKDNKKFLNTFLLSAYFDHISFKFEILEMLNLNKNNEHIKEKIMWSVEYYNKWFSSPEARSIEQIQITEDEINTYINSKL